MEKNVHAFGKILLVYTYTAKFLTAVSLGVVSSLASAVERQVKALPPSPHISFNIPAFTGKTENAPWITRWD